MRLRDFVLLRGNLIEKLFRSSFFMSDYSIVKKMEDYYTPWLTRKSVESEFPDSVMIPLYMRTPHYYL